MAILHQVLPHHAHGKSLRDVPGEAGIESRVRGHGCASEPVYKIRRSIPADSMHQVKMRSKLSSMDRSAALRVESGGRVPTGRSRMHVDLFESISRTKRPTVSCPPVHRHLDSMRLAVHKVLVGHGQNQMWRRWRIFEKGRGWFGGFLVGVIAVISSKIKREMFEKRRSVARLVGGQCLIIEVGIAH